MDTNEKLGRQVWSALVAVANGTETCKDTLKTIAAFACLSRMSTIRGIWWLEKGGHVQSEKIGRVNSYKLLAPPPALPKPKPWDLDEEMVALWHKDGYSEGEIQRRLANLKRNSTKFSAPDRSSHPIK
jgi:hypothetical protein